MNVKITAYILLASMGVLLGCKNNRSEKDIADKKITSGTKSFKKDHDFLKAYTDILVLENNMGTAKVAIAPKLQARVMTSTANGWSGKSYGWINKALFKSGDTLDHINAYGGEERLWLGPEGGQFSIFFKKGEEFTLDNWYVPKLIDLEPFELINKNGTTAQFTKTATLTNYTGFTFDLTINRTISVLSEMEIDSVLDLQLPVTIKSIGYSTTNVLGNNGDVAWEKENGLLSIWLLGMFNHTPATTVIVPYKQGPSPDLGPVVNDDYFGKVPEDRLKVTSNAIFFKADGQSRGKIGVSPQRARDMLGSFDHKENTLTIIKFIRPSSSSDYVNSKWEIQKEPFSGDVINAYNDGPPGPGVDPLGPFYEMETSSPAAALVKGEELTHIQYTFHFEGERAELEMIAQKTLGVSLYETMHIFK